MNPPRIDYADRKDEVAPPPAPARGCNGHPLVCQAEQGKGEIRREVLSMQYVNLGPAPSPDPVGSRPLTSGASTARQSRPTLQVTRSQSAGQRDAAKAAPAG